MERRLAAILAADVIGYSRLMEADENGTLTMLKAHRRELIDHKIAEHRGRLVKLMGDGALVEFASVVDAVGCAVEIQRGLVGRNKGVPEDRRIQFRVGVHLGDIIVEGDDIYGDGVNVAARLEGLAEPGGVCLSQQVHDQIETKLDLVYQDMGEQQVKNIARPSGSSNGLQRMSCQASDCRRPLRCPTSRRSQCYRSRICREFLRRTNPEMSGRMVLSCAYTQDEVLVGGRGFDEGHPTILALPVFSVGPTLP